MRLQCQYSNNKKVVTSLRTYEIDVIVDKIHHCRLDSITFIIEGKLFSLVVAIERKATPKATHD